MIGVARVQDNRREMSLIGRIREMLCFEADSTPFGEGCSVPAAETVGPVVCIDLYARFSGIYFQTASAFRFHTFGCEGQCTGFLLVQHVAMVVTGSVNQLLERFIDAASHCVRCAEVHRSSFHFGDFAGRDGNFIHGDIKVCVDSDDVVFHARSGIGKSCQIEKCVVCKIDDGPLVGNG